MPSLTLTRPRRPQSMPAHSFNQATFIGNLGRDPELRYTSQGTAICSFSLAVNDRKKGSDGEWQDNTLWVKVQLWRNQAESASQHLSKGRSVLVTGRLGIEEWKGNDGEKRFGLVLNAEKFVGIGASDSPPKAASKPPQTQTTKPSSDLPDLSDEDIPF